MDWHGKSIRMGAWVIVLAIVLRLWDPGKLEPFLVYLETGRVVHPQTEPTEVATTPPTQPTQPTELPRFSASDEELIYVWGTGKAVETAEFLAMPLKMDLTVAEPTVLILHTHATESYTETDGWNYDESSAYRTLDEAHNMCAIGAHLAQLLEAGGLRVIHDQTYHDYPEYLGAYYRAEDTANRYLEENPGIFLILDLHRDSISDGQGGELDTSATVHGQESAQLMFLMGTDHENWRDNMNLAVKLTALLEKTYPGITRGILTRNDDYNQYLTPGTLLVEVGAAGNTQPEAMLAVEALAEAILTLRFGTE